MTMLSIPARRDLFDKAHMVFSRTMDRILEYRSLAYLMQNPGVQITEEQLTENHASYVALRQALAEQFAADIAAADQLFAETLYAIQATADSTASAQVQAQPQVQPSAQPVVPPGWSLSLAAPPPPEAAVPQAPSPPPGPNPFGPDIPYEHPPDAPWIGALKKIESIEGILEQLPDEASDFVASVTEKLNSMREWIEKKHWVTDKMVNAIDSMENGAMRWLEGGKERGTRRHRG